MADYTQNIKVTADTRSAERSIDQLANKLGKLQNLGSGSGKAASGLRNIGEAFVPQRSLNALERGLQTITNRTNTAEKAFARLVEGVGTLAVSSQVLTGLNQVLKSTATYTGSVADNFSGAANKIDQFASSGSRLEGILGAVNNGLVNIAHVVERSVVPGFAALDDTAQATAKGVNSAQYALQRLLDSSDGLRAFVDNFGSISSATGVATAGLAALAAVLEGQLSNALYDIDKNAATALGQLAKDAAEGVSELQRLIRAGQGTVSQYENLLRIGKERQASYGSESEEGRKAANTIARAQQLLNAELEKQNDLLRAAQGLRAQSVENRATNTYNTTQRAKEYRAEELNRLNTELEDYARLAAEVAAQTKAWADNLTRVERSSKAGVLGNKNQLQARLEEMRANKQSAGIARERSAVLLGNSDQYARPAGPGGSPTAVEGSVQNMLKRRNQAEAQALEQLAQIELELERKVADYELDTVQKQLVAEIDAIETITNRQLQANKQLQKDFDKRLSGRTNDRKARDKQRSDMQGRIENTLVSGAFPLLFGAGPLATIGGFAGGALESKNPMMGVFTSAIGQMVDQFAAAAIDMGKALRDPITNFQKLADAGLLASKSQEYYIQRLIEVGRITEATAVIQAEMIKKIGASGVNDMQRAGTEADKLSKAWAELNLQMQAALAGPLANLLSWITAVVRLQGGQNSGNTQFDEISKALSPELRKKFQDEIYKVREGATAFSPDLDKLKAQQQAVFDKYRGLAPSLGVQGTTTSPEDQQKAADARLSEAERVEQLRRQGIQLENQAIDLRRNLEDQVYSFRQRAADLERANIDLRRSVEDEVFRKRQELARIESDNAREQARLAIERLDNQLQGMQVSGNVPGQDIANGLLSAVRDYVKTRAEAEADFQQKERNFKIEMVELEKASDRFKFEVSRKVADLQRQSADYNRDVQRAILAAERTIYDLQIAAADYRVAKAKEAIALEANAATASEMTLDLSGALGRLPGSITGRLDASGQNGGDMPVGPNNEIRSYHNGIVKALGTAGNNGNYVVIDFFDDLGRKLEATYSHIAATVKRGDRVVGGQVIGRFDGSGRTFGAHNSVDINSPGNNGAFQRNQETPAARRAADMLIKGHVLGGSSLVPQAGGGNVDGYLKRLAYLETRIRNIPNQQGSPGRGYFQAFPAFAADAIAASGGIDPRDANYDRSAASVKAWISRRKPDAYAAIQAGQYDTADALLRGTWPSLPGGSQAQGAGVQAEARRFLGGGAAAGGGGVANVPTAVPRPVSIDGAMAGLTGLRAPGVTGVADLMAANAALDQSIAKAKMLGLELAKAFSEMTKEGAAKALQQQVKGAIDQLNAPMDQLLKTQQDQLAFQREYSGLIAEGVTPALAEQLSKIREQVRLQLEQLDTALASLEATKLKLETDGKWTAELQTQLDLLKAQRGIIEGKGQQAEGGATQAQSKDQRLQDAYTKAKGELTELNDPVNQLVAGANAIGSAFGDAFKDVASGAKTAQQALADAFQGIANHFLDMASQMIAKWIEMQILGLAMSLFPGGGGMNGTANNLIAAPFGPSITGGAFATGGFVTGPTHALLGEGGSSGEYVIPENKMGSAMARWSSGMRGGAVLDGADPTGAGGGAAMADAPAQINIAGGVLNFNDSQYIKADQIPAIISQGAKQGEAKALRKLQMSPSTRRRVGVA